MKYLIDTHVFLWAMRSPAELSSRARNILADPRAELLLSMIVPWEIAIKSGTGKLKNSEEILADFEGLTAAAGFQVLETSIKHAIQSGLLPLHHKDPFDRLLIAQSLDLNIPVLSGDECFDRYGVKRVWR
ncbi:MAG: type II toxin-antitoxin system VapC family toxin [Acidobacteriota bacterium]